MDSIFGIGPSELILILLIAGIVMGPQRIAEIARWLGKITAQLQAISRDFMRQLNAELAATESSADLKEALADIQQLQKQVQDLKKELANVPLGTVGETNKVLADAQADLRQTLRNLSAPENSAQPTREVESEEVVAAKTAESMPTPLPKPLEVPDDPEI
ncbi:MAG: hypothetical protein D6706_09710 [Chloroflexi bacterium]|nr:MAG: hypothetical protein D6706_09710 [Chloroflexota bacterium]